MIPVKIIKLKNIMHHCYFKNDGTPRYKCIVLGNSLIFVQCGRHIFQQTVSIPMGTNWAPLLADLFLHSYEADFIADLIQKNEHR